MTEALIINLQQLTKSYGDTKALDDVSLSLTSGELLCILGPNGAGKTTLISAILGLVGTNSGSISLFGQLQVSSQRSLAIRQRLGVMMQIGTLSANLTVVEQCDLFSSYYPNGHSAEELVALAGLQAQAGQRFGRLSGGQKQRLLFALALAAKPSLLFLDEPTLGLDVEARQQLWQQVRQLKASGTAIILTTHYLEEAEQLADRVLVLQHGRTIAEGSPADLKKLTQYKIIQCHSSLSDDQLLALPAVIKISRQQQQVLLHSHQTEQTVRALLNEDLQVSELEVKPVALEETFLQLTQKPTPTTEEQAA